MKIAIASEGKDESSEVSPVSGRAPYYLIFDSRKLVKSIKNPFAFGGGGAGFSVAQMLGNEKVDAVVSGKFGPNITMALKQKGIKIIVKSGIKVKQALDESLKERK
ncbi:NifB/NifX family molybdenum-iron cluster-binding protein [Candidatus Woesearchaeota archaeon]|nr:NifB/NifX family molybdenum-iron cluster-binding protein [Candidatus Woesearchaeota archaeon]